MSEQEQLLQERKQRAKQRINEVLEEAFTLRRTEQITVEVTITEGQIEDGGLEIQREERVV